jgi:hypothetical protein
MTEYDVYSDEDSSVEAPPPPPSVYLDGGSAPRNSGNGGNSGNGNHPYEEQLKLFQGMAEYRDNLEGQGGDDDDDGSVEVPPPPELMERNHFQKKTADGSKKRHAVLYGGIALCLLLVMSIVLGVGFGTGAFKDDESSSSSRSVPAPSPTEDVARPTTTTNQIATDAKSIRVLEYLQTVVTNDAVFDNLDSPEAKALLWVQTEDPSALDPQDADSHVRLEQRYALMTLWYSSAFEWTDQTNWKDDNECEWFGVTCEMMTPNRRNLAESQFVVTGLNLEGNNLQGSIPRDLSMLEFLLVLNLSSNKLTGTLHPEINWLEFLQELYLNNNELSGNLEQLDLSLMTNLNSLDLSFNQFSGELPATFWELTSLMRLVLDANKFSGSISADIVYLTSLSK